MTYTPNMPNAPTPTPLCAAYESLLPLLETGALTSDEARATEEHVAICAWCRMQRAAYESLDAAARRHYSPGIAAAMPPQPLLRLEDIMRADEAETPLDDVESSDAPDDDDDALEVSALTPDSRMRRKMERHAGRGRLRLLAEIAAVLVVALLATTLVVSRLGLLGGGPAQPLKTAAGAVVFTHSVSWGRLTLNGQTISVATDGHHPLYLPRGRNTITYIAPPLPALTCTISAPAARSDTCPLFISPDGQAIAPFDGRLVDLEATPDHLSEAQRTAFLAAAQHALDAYTLTITIQPGDHYLTPEDKTLTANRSFPATLRYHLDVVGIGAGLDGCPPYCERPETRWSITPTITWEYIDQYGKPELVRQGSPIGESATDVDVMWTGQWKVTMAPEIPGTTLCTIIANLPALNNPPQNDSGQSWGYGMGCGELSSSQDGGKLVEVDVSDASGKSSRAGHILYRAGALMALDATAHTFLPSLPGPSAHELAIARQLGYHG